MLICKVSEAQLTFHVAGHDKMSHFVDSIRVLTQSGTLLNSEDTEESAFGTIQPAKKDTGSHHNIALCVLVDAHANKLLESLHTQIQKSSNIALTTINTQKVTVTAAAERRWQTGG